MPEVAKNFQWATIRGNANELRFRYHLHLWKQRIRTRLLKAYEVKTSNELMRLSILDGFYKPRTNEEIQAERENNAKEKLERRLNRLRKEG